MLKEAQAESIYGIIYVDSQQAVDQAAGWLYGFEVVLGMNPCMPSTEQLAPRSSAPRGVRPDDLAKPSNSMRTQRWRQNLELMEWFQNQNWDAIAARASYKSGLVAGFRMRIRPIGENMDMMMLGARNEKSKSVAEREVERFNGNALKRMMFDSCMMVSPDLKVLNPTNPFGGDSADSGWNMVGPQQSQPIDRSRRLRVVDIGDGDPAPQRRKVTPIG